MRNDWFTGRCPFCDAPLPDDRLFQPHQTVPCAACNRPIVLGAAQIVKPAKPQVSVRGVLLGMTIIVVAIKLGAMGQRAINDAFQEPPPVRQPIWEREQIPVARDEANLPARLVDQGAIDLEQQLDEAQEAAQDSPPNDWIPLAIDEPERQAQPSTNSPRYDFHPGRRFGYRYRVEAGEGRQREITHGEVHFTVQGPDAKTQPEQGEATGSAVVINSQGHLLTCAHVLVGATHVEVSLGDRRLQGRIVEMNKELDLAVIKVEADDLVPLVLADSDRVQIAEEVRAVGYPLSDLLGDSIKVTRGSIAGFIDQGARRLFQVDASINPGNSGGPLVDQRGLIVGIASAKLAGSEITNVGFAIPSAIVREFLEAAQIEYLDARKNDAAGDESPILDGPRLAASVIPSVAMLRVSIGPNGFGLEPRFRLTYSATINPSHPQGQIPDVAQLMRQAMQGHQRPRGTLYLDTTGELHDGDLDSHLPSLLGPIGLVGIERLPPTGQRVWRMQNQVTIHSERPAERNVRSPFDGMIEPRLPGFGPRGFGGRLGGHFHGPMGPRGPLDPFGEPPAPEPVVTLAVENNSYWLQYIDERNVKFRRQYQLETIERGRRGPDIKMEGEGSYEFDLQTGLTWRGELQASLIVSEGGIRVTRPVKFSYELLPDRPAAPANVDAQAPRAVDAGAQPAPPPEAEQQPEGDTPESEDSKPH